MKKQAWSLAVLLLAGLFSVSACLSTTEPRAERDARIGRVSLDGSRFEVQAGLAAVRSIEHGSLTLWASAPDITVEAELAADVSELTLSVQNAMPGAVLQVLSGNPSRVETVERDLPTRSAWLLEGVGGKRLRLRVAPPDADDADTFEFGLLSDIQSGIDFLYEIHDRINLEPNLRFVLGAGDLTQQGTEAQLREYQRQLEGLNVPYYTTLGNHELGTTPPPFQDFFGRGSFHFIFRGVHFSLLDSGSATIDPMVYTWLDEWLEAAKSSVHIVAMHIPPIDPIGVRNGSFASRNEAAKLLRTLALKGVDLTLYGHIHSYYEFENAGISARISGGGGAIPERFDKVGRHFVVVRVDPVSQEISTRRVDVKGPGRG